MKVARSLGFVSIVSRRRRAVCALLVAAALGAMPATRGVAAKPDKPVLAKIPAAMRAFVDRGDISGAVTVVGRADGILCYDAVGLRDLKSDTPMTEDTLFRIASMTKPITSLGIMILAEEGKLSIDDAVEKHLPEFKGQMLVEERSRDRLVLVRPPRKITLRDLLTHTSGLPGGFPPGLRDLYKTRDHSLAEGIMAVSQQPLNFEPGAKWSYCNAGMDTLGRIIEVAGGERYETFLKKRIFDPLGMKDTVFYPNQAQAARAAKTYGIKDGKLVEAPVTIIGPTDEAVYPIPAGGLYSTGADLARLYRMMLNRGQLDGARIVCEETVAEMTKVQTGELECGFVAGMSFGLGWGVVREPQGVTSMLSPGTYGHGGAFGTQGWMDPKQDLFVVLLIQRVGLKNGDASDMRRALQKLAVEAIGG